MLMVSIVGMNSDKGDYQALEFEINTTNSDAKIGSKSKLGSNEGNGSPKAKNFRLVDYSDDSLSSSDTSSSDTNGEDSLSSSDTFNDNSDDDTDSVGSSSSEEGVILVFLLFIII